MEPRTRNNPISPRNGRIPVEGFFFRLDGQGKRERLHLADFGAAGQVVPTAGEAGDLEGAVLGFERGDLMEITMLLKIGAAYHRFHGKAHGRMADQVIFRGDQLDAEPLHGRAREGILDGPLQDTGEGEREVHVLRSGGHALPEPRSETLGRDFEQE